MPRQAVTQGEIAGKDYTTPTVGASGRQIRRWVNDKTPGNALVVLTDAPAAGTPGIYYNLSANEIVYITEFCFSLDTVSDNIQVEIVMCSAAAGGGDPLPLTCHHHIYTGGAIAGYSGRHITLATPIAVPYSAASLSITVRVNANDAGAVICIGWKGYSITV